MINKETIMSVSKLLGFTAIGNEQDWAIEFADKNRIIEFIEILLKIPLSFSERYAIISLLLASYEDYLSEMEDYNRKVWKEIIKTIEYEKGEYDDLLNYWALWKETNEREWFNITPLVREYLSWGFEKRNC